MRLMTRYSPTQYHTIADYFSTLAAGWFSGGVIAPFFARVLPLERLFFFLIGFILSYFFLRLSLTFAREVDR